ncbi:MAG: Tm-1-like ATP-binding domain-containing protein, partial [Streptosporangiaceae bacterium]
MAAVALVGTLDTKGPDYAYLAERLRAGGVDVIVVDAGTGIPAGISPDIPAEQVAAAAGTTMDALRSAGD